MSKQQGRTLLEAALREATPQGATAGAQSVKKPKLQHYGGGGAFRGFPTKPKKPKRPSVNPLRQVYSAAKGAGRKAGAANTRMRRAAMQALIGGRPKRPKNVGSLGFPTGGVNLDLASPEQNRRQVQPYRRAEPGVYRFRGKVFPKDGRLKRAPKQVRSNSLSAPTHGGFSSLPDAIKAFDDAAASLSPRKQTPAGGRDDALKQLVRHQERGHKQWKNWHDDMRRDFEANAETLGVGALPKKLVNFLLSKTATVKGKDGKLKPATTADIEKANLKGRALDALASLNVKGVNTGRKMRGGQSLDKAMSGGMQQGRTRGSNKPIGDFLKPGEASTFAGAFSDEMRRRGENRRRRKRRLGDFVGRAGSSINRFQRQAGEQIGGGLKDAGGRLSKAVSNVAAKQKMPPFTVSQKTPRQVERELGLPIKGGTRPASREYQSRRINQKKAFAPSRGVVAGPEPPPKPPSSGEMDFGRQDLKNLARGRPERKHYEPDPRLNRAGRRMMRELPDRWMGGISQAGENVRDTVNTLGRVGGNLKRQWNSPGAKRNRAAVGRGMEDLARDLYSASDSDNELAAWFGAGSDKAKQKVLSRYRQKTPRQVQSEIGLPIKGGTEPAPEPLSGKKIPSDFVFHPGKSLAQNEEIYRRKKEREALLSRESLRRRRRAIALLEACSHKNRRRRRAGVLTRLDEQEPKYRPPAFPTRKRPTVRKPSKPKYVKAEPVHNMAPNFGKLAGAAFQKTYPRITRRVKRTFGFESRLVRRGSLLEACLRKRGRLKEADDPVNKITNISTVPPMLRPKSPSQSPVMKAKASAAKTPPAKTTRSVPVKGQHLPFGSQRNRMTVGRTLDQAKRHLQGMRLGRVPGSQQEMRALQGRIATLGKMQRGEMDRAQQYRAAQRKLGDIEKQRRAGIGRANKQSAIDRIAGTQQRNKERSRLERLSRRQSQEPFSGFSTPVAGDKPEKYQAWRAGMVRELPAFYSPITGVDQADYDTMHGVADRTYKTEQQLKKAHQQDPALNKPPSEIPLRKSKSGALSRDLSKQQRSIGDSLARRRAMKDKKARKLKSALKKDPQFMKQLRDRMADEDYEIMRKGRRELPGAYRDDPTTAVGKNRNLINMALGRKPTNPDYDPKVFNRLARASAPKIDARGFGRKAGRIGRYMDTVGDEIKLRGDVGNLEDKIRGAYKTLGAKPPKYKPKTFWGEFMKNVNPFRAPTGKAGKSPKEMQQIYNRWRKKQSAK